MIYSLEIKPDLDKIFKRLVKKNRIHLKVINNKIKYIRANPFKRYKLLGKPLEGFNRIHLNNSFVLVFRIDHFSKKVVLYHYEHHDKVYSWRPE